MNLEEELYELFDRSLSAIEDKTDARISPKWSSLRILKEEWADFLDGIPGLERVGKIVGLVVEEKEGRVRIKDPLVLGGNQGFLSLPYDSAVKMVALGHIPSSLDPTQNR